MPRHPLQFGLDLENPVDRIQDLIETYAPENCADAIGTFEIDLMRNHNLRIVSVSPDDHRKVIFSMTIGPSLCSRRGMMHGGAASLIFDMLTSIAIAPIAKPGFWEFSGVSHRLCVSYHRPTPVGTEVLVESELVGIGKKTALIIGRMVRKDNGAVLCSVEHDKTSVKIDRAAGMTNLAKI